MDSLKSGAMRFLFFLTGFFFIVALPTFYLSTTITMIANQESFYNAGFRKYDIASQTGIEEVELSRIAGQLIEYFNSSEEYLDIKVTQRGRQVELFNKREIEHMKDVKGMIRFGYLTQWLSFLYVATFATIGLLWQKRVTYKLLLWGSIGTLFLIFLLAGAVLFDFQGFFLGFHLISFSNDFWVLDPARDNLIRMFPEGFFFDAALYISMAVAVEAAAVSTLMAWLLKSRRTTGIAETA
jgi:integral membrane protein (TIGR01906 family)